MKEGRNEVEGDLESFVVKWNIFAEIHVRDELGHWFVVHNIQTILESRISPF